MLLPEIETLWERLDELEQLLSRIKFLNKEVLNSLQRPEPIERKRKCKVITRFTVE